MAEVATGAVVVAMAAGHVAAQVALAEQQAVRNALGSMADGGVAVERVAEATRAERRVEVVMAAAARVADNQAVAARVEGEMAKGVVGLAVVAKAAVAMVVEVVEARVRAMAVVWEEVTRALVEEPMARVVAWRVTVEAAVATMAVVAAP